MAYGFSEKTSTTGGGSYIDEAGFYTARVGAVSYENSKNDGSGKTVLTFKFETEDGKSFRHIEWDIDEQRTRQTASEIYQRGLTSGKPPKDKQQNVIAPQVFAQQFLENEYENQGARIKHILEAYGAGNGNISASDYASFAQKVVALFKQTDTSAYKPLLIVYNNKDFASLPRYAPFFGVSEEALRAKATQKKYKLERTPKDDDGEGGSHTSGGDDEF